MLRFLHSRGVVYRDVKPDNAVLAADGYPVFVDLAFARSLPFVRQGVVVDTASTQLGSAEYMAPEVGVSLHPRCAARPARRAGGVGSGERVLMWFWDRLGRARPTHSAWTSGRSASSSLSS